MAAQKKTPQLSVIIPAHQVPQQYLRELEESLRNSSFSDFEVLLCECQNGAADVQALLDITKRDARFSVLPCSGMGVSAARNEGLAQARGTFITFVDADDKISPVFFEQALSLLESTQADAVFGHAGYSAAEKQSNDAESFTSAQATLCTGKDLVALRRTIASGAKDASGPVYQGRDLGYVWAKVFRRQLLADLSFDLGLAWGEDTLFVVQAAGCAQSIVVVDEPWYYYRRHVGSASISDVKNMLEKMKSLDQLRQLYKTFDQGEQLFNLRIFNSYASSFQDLLKYSGRAAAKQYLRGIYKLPGMQQVDQVDFSGFEPSKNKRVLQKLFHARSVRRTLGFAQAIIMRDGLR